MLGKTIPVRGTLVIVVEDLGNAGICCGILLGRRDGPAIPVSTWSLLSSDFGIGPDFDALCCILFAFWTCSLLVGISTSLAAGLSQKPELRLIEGIKSGAVAWIAADAARAKGYNTTGAPMRS